MVTTSLTMGSHTFNICVGIHTCISGVVCSGRSSDKRTCIGLSSLNDLPAINAGLDVLYCRTGFNPFTGDFLHRMNLYGFIRR